MSGEIDRQASSDVFAAGVTALVDGQCLVIDLGDVTFLDSGALGALIDLRNAASVLLMTLTLINIPPGVRRIFDIAGLSPAFGIGRPSLPVPHSN